MPQTLQPAADLEVLDLRHFAGVQLAPLLRDETLRWNRRLRWDYTRASDLLREHIDGRILPGFVALRNAAIAGFAFCVYEAAKAVIGDIYALGETESIHNPVCETLLVPLLELLQNTPGVDRIEAQLLMFPAGALTGPFSSAGFHNIPRLFMSRNLTQVEANATQAEASFSEGEAGFSPLSPHPLKGASAPGSLPPNLILRAWQPNLYDAAADLIHRAYAGHMDADINDQYRTLHGAQRFLHNIIRFPGCGIFAPDLTWVLQDRRTDTLHGLVLGSRVRQDTAHITQLCISPGLRATGLGNRLLQHCAADAAHRGLTALTLTVTEANAGALRLYERHGFTTLHRFEAWVWESHAHL